MPIRVDPEEKFYIVSFDDRDEEGVDLDVQDVDVFFSLGDAVNEALSRAERSGAESWIFECNPVRHVYFKGPTVDHGPWPKEEEKSNSSG